MTVKKFENMRWESYDQELVFRHKVAINFISGGDVLDLGCGDGLFLDLLKDKKIYGIGLDISEEAVAKCKEKGLDARLFDFSNSKLPFSHKQFKYVIILDCLEHLYQPEELLREAARVAEKVIIGVPNFNSLPARLQVILGKVPENNSPRKGHCYWFNYSVLKKMIEQNDLRIEKIYFNTFWENVLLVKYIMKIIKTVWPNIFALSYVVLVKNNK